MTTVCTATSPFKMNIFQASTSKLSAKRKLNFFEEESDDSFTPATEGSTVDYESSPYKISSQSKTTSDGSTSQEEFIKQKINLVATLAKVKNKPRSYIGVPKDLYFLIDLIKKHTNF